MVECRPTRRNWASAVYPWPYRRWCSRYLKKSKTRALHGNYAFIHLPLGVSGLGISGVNETSAVICFKGSLRLPWVAKTDISLPPDGDLLFRI